MSYPWHPLEGDGEGDNATTNSPGSIEAWAELFATTIAHLAAQLTMTQLRLRALATVAAESGVVDRDLIAARLAEISEQETGTYLRENLGVDLAEAIDLDNLTREIATYLRGESMGPS